MEIAGLRFQRLGDMLILYASKKEWFERDAGVCILYDTEDKQWVLIPEVFNKETYTFEDYYDLGYETLTEQEERALWTYLFRG